MLNPRPSGAYRWTPCPASVRLEAQFPDDGTTALEGRAAHWLSETCLRTGCEPGPFLNFQHENGKYVTEEMVEAVAVYLTVCRNHPGGAIEQRVTCAQVSLDYGGTPDFWYFDPATMTLYVIDLKYGRGIVEPYENFQLISYAVGIIAENFPGAELHIKVCLTIVQPRPWHPQGPVRSWRVDAPALRPITNRMHNAYGATFSPSPMACSGPHCRYCRALAVCHNAEQAAAHAVDISGEATTRGEPDPEQVATELMILTRALEALQWRKDAVETVALSLGKQGRPIPGWSATSGAGRLAWSHPRETVLAVGQAHGLDLGKKDVITPLQAETAGLPRAVMAQYSERRPGKVSLKPDGKKIKQLFYRSV